ncbi:MAG: DUF6516 family protein [Caldilinea sp.]|nr:hypothetical protein [Caldilineaceae bacterium]MCB9119908.1 hypothetical protein [Caldilineaceae bacterium]MCO5209099.1 DUF6516 family protein [Caldilinea sp.]
MIPAEYLDQVKVRLLTDTLVAEFEIRRERSTLVDAHIRVRVSLVDRSMLEFSEYVTRTADGQIDVVVYSYHWESAAQQLICRWDNVPHFPGLPGFPHHFHDGRTQQVAPGQPMTIFSVLDKIREILSQ